MQFMDKILKHCITCQEKWCPHVNIKQKKVQLTPNNQKKIRESNDSNIQAIHLFFIGPEMDNLFQRD